MASVQYRMRGCQAEKQTSNSGWLQLVRGPAVCRVHIVRISKWHNYWHTSRVWGKGRDIWAKPLYGQKYFWSIRLKWAGVNTVIGKNILYIEFLKTITNR